MPIQSLSSRWTEFKQSITLDTTNPQTFEIGAFRVVFSVHIDDDPDYSYLGEFCHYKDRPDSYLMHLDSGAIWDGTIWRDERGKITSEPEFSNRSREYQFADLGTCQFERGEPNAFKCAVENGRRLRGLSRDWWWYVGVWVTIWRGNVELAGSSLWGIESDSGDEYAREVFEDLLHDCLHQAGTHRYDPIRCNQISA